MDGQQYQYRATTQIVSGGYPGEDANTIPADTRAIMTDAATGTQTYRYYFRDSASMNNTQSSRVVLNITDSWEASFDDANNLTITVTTTVNSIVRDDVKGNPSAGGTATRNIYLRRTASGSNIASFTGDNINTAHTISGSRSIGSTTFTLAPGGAASRSSLYVLACVPGHENDSLPSIYVDVMGVGIQFTNTLPPDYRPGAIWGGSSWLSHNRKAGCRNIYSGSSWNTLRSENGGVGTGNPPSIVHSDGVFRNQRKLGKE